MGTNLGNIRLGKKGEITASKGIEQDIADMDDNLRAYGEKHGVKTLKDVISRWSPPKENDTENLIKYAAQRTGLDPTEEVDLSNPIVRKRIIPAIVHQENGKNVTPEMFDAVVNHGGTGYFEPRDIPEDLDLTDKDVVAKHLYELDRAGLTGRANALFDKHIQTLHEGRTGGINAAESALEDIPINVRRGVATAAKYAGAEDFAREQEDKARKAEEEKTHIFEPTTEEDIKRAKEKNGVLGEVGAKLSKHITEPLGSMAGYVPAMVGGAALAPEAGALGIATGALGVGTQYLAHTGELNKEGVSPGKALVYGAGQTGVDVLLGPIFGKATKWAESMLSKAPKETISRAVGNAADTAEAAYMEYVKQAMAKSGRAEITAEEQLGAYQTAEKAAKEAIENFSTQRSYGDIAKQFGKNTAMNAVSGAGMMVANEDLRRLARDEDIMGLGESLDTAEQAGILSPIFGGVHTALHNPATAVKARGQHSADTYANDWRPGYALAENAVREHQLAEEEQKRQEDLAKPFHPEHTPEQVWDAMRAKTASHIDVPEFKNLDPQHQEAFTESLPTSFSKLDIKSGSYEPVKKANDVYADVAKEISDKNESVASKQDWFDAVDRKAQDDFMQRYGVSIDEVESAKPLWYEMYHPLESAFKGKQRTVAATEKYVPEVDQTKLGKVDSIVGAKLAESGAQPIEPKNIFEGKNPTLAKSAKQPTQEAQPPEATPVEEPPKVQEVPQIESQQVEESPKAQEIPPAEESINPNNHTLSTIKTKLFQDTRKPFGDKWADSLLNTGKFNFIDKATARENFGEKAAKSQSFYDPSTGETHFVHDNIAKTTDLKSLLQHEIAVHALRMGKTDKVFGELLNSAGRLVNSDSPIAKKAKAYAEGAKTPEADMREEYLAYLVEHHPDLSLSQRAVSWMRNAVRKVGDTLGGADKFVWTKWASRLNEKDLAYMATKALRTAPVELPKMQPKGEVLTEDSLKYSMTPDEQVLHDLDAVTHRVHETEPGKLQKFLFQYLDKWEKVERKLAPHLDQFDPNGRHRADRLGHTYDQIHNVIMHGLTRGGIEVGRDQTISVKPLTIVDHTGKTITASLVNMQKLADSLGENGRSLVQQVMYVKDTAAQLKRDPSKVGSDVTSNLAKFRRAEQAANAVVNSHPEIRDILTMWQAINKNLIEASYDSGLINAETRRIFLAEPDYVPRYMLREEIAEHLGVDTGKPITIGNTHTKIFRERTASDHKINVWENLAKHYSGVTLGVAANTLKRAIGEQLVEVGEATEVARSHHGEQGNLAVMIDGKRKFYMIDDPSIVPPLTKIMPELGPFMTLHQKGIKVFRFSTLTNVKFFATEIVRNTIAASLYSDLGFFTPVHTLGEMFKPLMGKDETFKKLADHGLIGSTEAGLTPADLSKFVKDIGTQMQPDSLAGKTLHGMGKATIYMHNLVNGATIAAVYKAALKRAEKLGIPADKRESYAIMEARETLNFSISGNSEWSRNMRSMYPFYSAQTNAMLKLFRTATARDVPEAKRTQARARFYKKAVTYATLAAAYAIYQNGNPDWHKLSDDHKFGSISVPTGDAEHPFVHFALPQELAPIFSLPTMLVEAYCGTKTGNQIMHALYHSLRQMTPLGMGDTGYPITQLGKPVVETIANHDFYTGKPIESISEQKKPIKHRGEMSSSRLAVLMSQYGGGSLGLSPAKIDHLLRGWFTHMAQGSMWVADKMLQDEDTPVKPSKDFDVPFLQVGVMFTGANEDVNRDEFYKNKVRIEEVQNYVAALRNDGRGSEIKAYLNEGDNRALYGMADFTRNRAELLASLNTQIRRIKNSKTIKDGDVKQEKIHKLQAKINKLAASYNADLEKKLSAPKSKQDK